MGASPRLHWEHTDQLLAFPVDLTVNLELLPAWSIPSMLCFMLRAEKTESFQFSISTAWVGKRMIWKGIHKSGCMQGIPTMLQEHMQVKMRW